MRPKAKLLLGACLLVVGALLFLSLWVYPFHYGFTESAVLAGLLVCLALVEIVLDNASI
ncbi:hypothetical protein [Haladaptatus sp. W1]|uniref:hypothetical protein n=1 Tax=Haladaptatus sp. W1 TaxID=1897478 RepID=UPI00158698AC|nr:hypothetical protein [Haladaptatus sp. W1]